MSEPIESTQPGPIVIDEFSPHYRTVQRLLAGVLPWPAEPEAYSDMPADPWGPSTAERGREVREVQHMAVGGDIIWLMVCDTCGDQTQLNVPAQPTAHDDNPKMQVARCRLVAAQAGFTVTWRREQQHGREDNDRALRFFTTAVGWPTAEPPPF